jgi:hypothetical protein
LTIGRQGRSTAATARDAKDEARSVSTALSWIVWIAACMSWAALLGLLCAGAAWRRWLSCALASALLVVPFWVQQGTVLRAAIALELLWICVKVFGLARDPSARSAGFRVLQLLVLHDLRQDGLLKRGARPQLALRTLLLALLWGGAAALALWLALFVAPALPLGQGFLLRCAAGAAFAYAGVEAALGLFLFVYRSGGLQPPSLHRQPILSTSIGEFWGRRWNRIVGSWLFGTFYRPLAVRGHSLLGIVAAFLASAALHLYFTWAAIGLGPALRMALFFLTQLPLLLAELHLQQARWPGIARRAWTIGWLTLTSPLFVEPMLDILAGGFAS